MKNKEIERKWILSKWPSMPPAEDWMIEQFYVYTDEQFEIRCRARHSLRDPFNASWKLTVKLGNGLIRDEVESELTYKEYLKYRALCAKTPIQKHYRVYKLDSIEFQISKVDNNWLYAKVEFDSIEDANAFTLEDFFVRLDAADWREVTNDKMYQMKNYWRETRFMKGVNNHAE